MIFDGTKASDWNYKGKVSIKTLEELLLFMEFNQEDIIIRRKHECEIKTRKGEVIKYTRPWEIEIYDSYIE